MTKTLLAGWLTVCMALGFALTPERAAAASETSGNAGAAVHHLKQGEEMLTRLKNGLTVYIIKDARFPLVCTRLYVGTGSANERPDQAGISHVLEHMVFKGTKDRPKGQIAQDVEELGGYLNAATSFDMTYYLTDMPAKHWRTGMDVVRDMAFNATLDAEELESEKNVIVSELQGDDDEPRRRLFESLQVAGLKNSVYGRPIIGFEETIRAVTVQDLRDYIATWYQPQNMLLLVAGDIEPQQVLAHAEKLFGGLKNTADLTAPAPVDLVHAPGGPRVEVVRGPWSKVYLGLSLPVPGLPDIRSVDLDVLTYVLGGDGTSTFYRKYQYEKRLVDSIAMGNMGLRRAGLVYLTATLDVNNLESFWEGLTRDLAGLSGKDFPKDAIERARFNLADSVDRAGETLNGLASWRGTVQFELGGREGERNLRSALSTVDGLRLEEALRQWIRPERARVRVLVPQDVQIPDLEAILDRNWKAAAAESAAPTAEAGAAASQTIDLGQGRTLILQRDATVPYVALSFRQGGGNALLVPQHQGLAELTARTLTDGYGDKDAQAVERWFSERAAQLSASAGLQTFAVDMSGPARFTHEYFQQLDSLLRSPRFEKKDMERQVQNMKAALARRQDNPQALLFARVRPFLFPQHCYGFDSLGTPANLDSFTRENLVNYWKRQSSLPWVLTLTGDFDPAAVKAWAAQLPVPAAASSGGVSSPRWTEEKTLGIHAPGRNQAYLLQVFPTVPQDHPDAPALMLLDAILSGQSGLLFSKMRDEQGLGYTVTSFYQSLPEAGLMAFYIGTTPDKVEQARKGFAGIIEDVRQKPLPAALLEKGFNRLEGEYYRGRQSLGARSTESATLAILGLPETFRRDVLEKASRLTPADVQEAARKYLAPEACRELLLTPEGAAAAPATPASGTSPDAPR